VRDSQSEPSTAISKPVSLGDLDELLSLAEKLQSLHEQARSRSIGLAALALMFAIAAAITLVSPERLSFRDPFRIGLLSIFLVGAFALAYSGMVLRARARLDRRDGYKIVRTIHEVLDPAVQQAGWSELRSLSFKIRLSRLRLGPTEYSDRVW
jgi:hypothetical protein